MVDLISRACRQAVLLLPGVDWVSVTAQIPGHATFTASHTDDRALRVDEYQYAADDGPCLQAMRVGRTVRMTTQKVLAVWHELGVAAQ